MRLRRVSGVKASSAIVLLILATAAVAQETMPSPPPGHDISQVDAAPLGGAINVPLPEDEEKRLRRYDIPELAGAKQAIGPQPVGGRLPRPLVDYSIQSGKIVQRLSLFEGGLAVLNMRGAGGVIRKKLILPPDALKAYLKPAQARELRGLRPSDLPMLSAGRLAVVRVYDTT